MNPELKFKAAPVGSLWIVDPSERLAEHPAYIGIVHIIPETETGDASKDWQTIAPGSIVMKLGRTFIDKYSDIEKVLSISNEGQALVGWLFGHSISFLIPYEEHQVQERVTIKKPWLNGQGLLGGTRKD